MKKLIFASVFALATLTACQNSESSMSTPEDQNHQTFTGKTAAREGETSDEKEAANEAIEIIKKDEEVGGGSDSRILCHTSYFSDFGHACVQQGGYLFNVDWHPMYVSSDGNIGIPVDNEFNPIVYNAHQVSSCNCR